MGLLNETDNTYQHGLTSLLPINFEINVTQDSISGTYTNAFNQKRLRWIVFSSYFVILIYFQFTQTRWQKQMLLNLLL